MSNLLSNLSAVLNAAHKNGDPLRTMTLRTSGLSLADVHQFSAGQIISAAFGQGVAQAVLRPDGTVRGDCVTAELFVLYAKLFLKQMLKPGAASIASIPVAPGQSVAAPTAYTLLSTNPRAAVMSANIPGLDWLSAIGEPASIPASVKKEAISMLEAMPNLRKDDESIIDWLKANADLRRHSDLIADCLAKLMPEVTFYGSVGAVAFEQPNLKVMNAQDFWAFNFHATAADVAYVASEIARISTLTGASSQIALVPGTHEGVQVMFMDFESGKDSGYRRVMIHPTDGVYEMARMRRFGQTLVTSCCQAVTAEDFSLLSSYQTFMTWLFRFLPAFMGTSQSVKEIGLMYDKYIKNDDRTKVVITAVEDLGAVDGDRQHLDSRSTKVRAYSEHFSKDGECLWSWVPFTFQYHEAGQVRVIARPLKVMELAVQRGRTPQAGSIEAPVFEHFNLVRQISSNGALLDGRRACIRVEHIPTEYKQEFVKLMEDRYLGGKSWATHAGSNRKEDCTDKLVLCLSSKVAKLIKRTTMDGAVVASMVNGKQRHSRIWGQKYKSENNVMVPAVISQHLLGAAGNAYYWDEKLFGLENPKVQSFSPDIVPVRTATGEYDVNLVKPGSVTESSTADGWTVISWDEPPFIAENEEVAFFVYAIDGRQYEFPVLNRLPEVRLEELHYRVANTVGRNKSLEVKILTRGVEPAIKARNHVKAVMAPCSETVFNNGLNNGLFAKAIFPADTNKWGDLVKSKFDVVAATFTENKEHALCHRGYKMLREANAAIGCSHHDDSIWAPIAAAMGLYDEVMAEFDRIFGRAVWTMWNDGLTGDWSTGLKLLYMYEGRPVDGWHEVSAEEFPFSNMLSEFKAIADGDVSDPGSNILIFGLNKTGENVLLQRGFSFVGTEDCPVYQPVKGELSSVIDNIGYSDTMAGVLRMIAQEDRETAISLMHGNAKRVHRSAALHMMANGSAVNPVACVTPTGLAPEVSILRTDAVREIVSGPSFKGRVLPELTKLFGDKFFTFENGTCKFSINLAILCSQDANLDFASDESLSAVVEYLFRAVALGTTAEITPLVNNLMARVASKLKSLVESAGINKACSVGGPVLGARSAGIPGIPASELWVAESGDSRSVYQKFVRGFKNVLLDLGKFTGVKVYGYRAPMTSPMVLKLVVIKKDDHRYKLISPYMWNTNCLVNNIHGGDNDGDTNYFAPLVKNVAGCYVESNIPFTTLETIFESVKLRTGSDQLACLDDHGINIVKGGERYYADHNNIKTKAAIDKKNGVSAKNLILINNEVSDSGEVDNSTMTAMLTRSTEMIKVAVGQTHTFVLQADIFACLMNDLIQFGYSDADKSETFFACLGIIAALYEIYEVPLGGLDDAAYDILFNLLIPLSKKPDAAINPLPYEDYLVDGALTGRQYWINKFDEAGMCSQLFDQILEAACTIGNVTESVHKTYKSDWYNADAENRIVDNQFGFVSAVTYLTLLLSKGRVRASYNAAGQLNKTGKILLDVVNTIKGNEYLTKLANQDLVLQSLMTHNDLMIGAMTGQHIEIDFSLFTEQSNKTDEDNNDDQGGGSAVGTDPESPQDPTPSSDSEESHEEINMSNFDNFKSWVDNLPDRIKALPEWGTMSDDQLMAMFVICNGGYDCVTLTGRAGSGKSFTTQFAAKVLTMLGKEVHVTGTTGVATINAGGTNTINSLAKIGKGSDSYTPIGHSDYSAGSKRFSIGRQASVNFKSYGPEVVIFIDEISMASPENLVLAYQSIHNAIGKSRPFRFVLVGDFRQLAPVKSSRFAFEDAEFVIKDDTKGDYTLRFGSFMKEGPFNKDGDRLKKEWKSVAVSLIHNHRQKSDSSEGAAFIDALNALGEGKDFNDPIVLPISKRVFVRSKDGQYKNMATGEVAPNTDDATHAFTVNDHVKEHNEKIKNMVVSKGECQVRNYKARIVPAGWSREEILDHVSPIEANQTLYTGQKFMVRSNIPNSVLKNGTVGVIVGMQDDKITLRLPSGETTSLEKNQFPLPDLAQGSAGVFESVAMGHGANGSTVWKLQGITLKSTEAGCMEESLVVNLKRRPFGNAHGLAYVFCSRVQNLDQLYILVDDLNYLNKYVHCDPRVKEFIEQTEQNMKALLEEQKELPVEKTKFVSVVKARRSSSSDKVGVIVNLDSVYYDVHYDAKLLPIGFQKFVGTNESVAIEPDETLKLELIEATLVAASEVK